MNGLVRVYIEIEKESNMKYEFCKEAEKLVLDRILPEPYSYPFAYGFIVDTKAADGDELDILIITDKHVVRDRYYNAYIVGVLVMEDEKGMDEKVLCVLEEEREDIKDINDISSDKLESIHNFFTHYKSQTPGKWSRVYDFQNKEFALKLYNKHKLNNIVYLNSRQ